MTTPAKTNPSSAADGSLAKALRLIRQNTILVLVLILIAFIAGIDIARPGTVNPTWISNMLLFAAPLGILAAGQTLVMLTGGIDLSVASVATGSAYLLATNSSHGNLTAVLLGLALGLAVGSLNGVGIALLRVQPLVMTLGTGLMTEGVMIVYGQNMLASEPRVPAFIQTLGAGKIVSFVPVNLFLWLPIAIVIIVGLRQSGFGRLIYAVGDNREACQLSGIRVWKVLLVDYVLCSLLAAVAGLVLVGSTNAADLSLADVYLLPSVAAVIIGGTSIFGGRGGYAGSIVGALILTVLTSMLTLLDFPEPMKQILYGAIILLLAATYARLID
jgi:ribose transport system permease protein